MIRRLLRLFPVFLFLHLSGLAQENLTPPPQDQGLPYTRSARAGALAKIKDTIAVYAGSRYAYVKGFKVRLNDADLLGSEAQSRNGKIFVPNVFAAVLDLKEVNPPPAPPYLAAKWVYSLHLPPAPDGWTDMETLAKDKGLKSFRDPRGLLLISEKDITFSPAEKTILESVITLFDTPEKYADPAIPAEYIPTLKAQGPWTDIAKASQDQLKILNGPETVWPEVPQSDYDFTGFNQKLLGSKVPPPGVYPRVLFSPEDIPGLAARIKSSRAGQKSLMEMAYLFKKSWWDPATSDGQVFAKLSSGNLKGLEWDAPPGTPAGAYPALFKGEKPGIYFSHVSYVPECLTSMALYCLLTSDDLHGRQAAAAIANYYKLREPLLDEINSISDSEYGSSYTRPDGSVVIFNGSGSTTHWRTHGGLGGGIGAHMNLGLALDFAGKWMTPDEKDSVRRFIAKATYGRRSYGQDGPIRWRDINWVTWDLSDYLAVTSIEGLEGYDPEVSAAGARTVKAFLNFGIDDSGIIYESNGKTPGGLQFLTLSMVSLARRGDNQWGNPHWRKFLPAEVQTVSPTGRVNVNSGTQYVPYSRQYLSFQFVEEMKSFFPDEHYADYLLNRAGLFGGLREETVRQWLMNDFDPATYQSQMEATRNLRLPSPTYPGFVHGVLYSADFDATPRQDLNFPLDFSAPVHGLFSSSSDRTSRATWINMLVRPDHYLGAGHHHADAGMFHFSALGVDWFTQSPFPGVYDGKYFNLVQVDGHSEAETIPKMINGYNARATYLGAVMQPSGAAAAADLTYAYSYRWMTQPPQRFDDYTKNLGWELEPDPHILSMFAGTGLYKMRPWWPTSNYSNYYPTLRAPFNPMQYVFRTVGLVRGPHPYSFIADDLKKDDSTHLYQWAGMLNGGVIKASQDGLPANELALAYTPPPSEGVGPPPASPTLLVVTLGQEKADAGSAPLIQYDTATGPPNAKGQSMPYNRLLINQQATEVHYRVLLLPMEKGGRPPSIQYDKASQTASVDWGDQHDQIIFSTDSAHRTYIRVQRGGETLVDSG
jgi:hypothetical protein